MYSQNAIHLGTFGHRNGLVPIGDAVFTDVPGDWRIELEFNGQLHKMEIDNVVGNPITLNIDGLNEDYFYYGRIIDGDGLLFAWEQNGETFDSFRLQIMPEL